MPRQLARGPSTGSSDLVKAPGFSLPPKLLEKAVTRLCIVAMMSAVFCVAFFAADGFLQPEAAYMHQHPVTRLMALFIVLLSFAFAGVQTAGWFSKQTILSMGCGFQVLIGFAISLTECSLVSSSAVPVVGVSSTTLWLVVCGMLIPNTPSMNLLTGILTALTWPLGYYAAILAFGHDFIGWNRVAMWMIPMVLAVVLTNFLNRRMYTMQVESQRAEDLG
ncbi:MAG: hypothetical protein JST65_03785, partial [Acidobacteria bacterium]|nr:hypothetical protein [Acidobacteriota bacterium]